MSSPPDVHRKAETIFVDQDNNELAIVDAFLWPPVGAVVELGNPNRDGVVREVRLKLFPGFATVYVSVYDRDEIVPPTSDGGRTRYPGA
jgi:hypothetical protein